MLSNFYKIILRAINNHLKVISNRILSRAQKGFNQQRQIQEAIINTLETIDYCKRENIKGYLYQLTSPKHLTQLVINSWKRSIIFLGLVRG